jgi:hypothetical protein
MHGPGFATLKDQRPNMLPNASQPTKRTLLKAAEIASTASIMLNRLQTDIYSMVGNITFYIFIALAEIVINKFNRKVTRLLKPLKTSN